MDKITGQELVMIVGIVCGAFVLAWGLVLLALKHQAIILIKEGAALKIIAATAIVAAVSILVVSDKVEGASAVTRMPALLPDII